MLTFYYVFMCLLCWTHWPNSNTWNHVVIITKSVFPFCAETQLALDMFSLCRSRWAESCNPAAVPGINWIWSEIQIPPLVPHLVNALHRLSLRDTEFVIQLLTWWKFAICDRFHLAWTSWLEADWKLIRNPRKELSSASVPDSNSFKKNPCWGKEKTAVPWILPLMDVFSPINIQDKHGWKWKFNKSPFCTPWTRKCKPTSLSLNH